MTKEQISKLIESRLGFTNGWSIPRKDYKKTCDEIALEIMSKLGTYHIPVVPYQACPICNGSGEIVADGFTSGIMQACSVCHGEKIIPMCVIKQED